MARRRPPQPGDVYWIDPNPISGREMKDRHRFVVITPKEINALGIAAHASERFPHGSKIDDCGNAREVLQQHAGGHEGNLFFGSAGPPACQRANIVGMNETAIFAAQQILEKYAQRKGKLRKLAEALLLQKFEAVNVESLGADIELVACAERVARVNGHSNGPFAGRQPSMITEIEFRCPAAILVRA